MYKAEILPTKLREGREYRNLDQKEIANLLGIHVSSYGKYELGFREPNAILIPKIANIEKLDINFYFDPNMTTIQADLNLKENDTAIEKLTKKIEKIETKIDPNKDTDPLIERVKAYKPLRDLIELVQYWEGGMLRRFTDMAYAYLAGTRNETEKKFHEKKEKGA